MIRREEDVSAILDREGAKLVRKRSEQVVRRSQTSPAILEVPVECLSFGDCQRLLMCDQPVVICAGIIVARRDWHGLVDRQVSIPRGRQGHAVWAVGR
jgi:hypothetical protein